MLRHLNDARHLRATLVALSRRPAPAIAPLLAPTDRLPAANVQAAQSALAETLRQTAAREGVLVEVLQGLEIPAKPIASVEIAVSGDAAHVLRFAEAIENRTPVIRFSLWRIVDLEGSANARLDARASIAWETKP